MFGYVKPFQPEMKIKEFEAYKAVYCGLCKQLGRCFGPIARCTLNYDYAFLSILAMAVEPESPHFEKQRCIVNPLKKKTCCCQNNRLQLISCVAMSMFYYKVKDNIKDNSFLKKLPFYFILPFGALARRKSRKLHPEIDELMVQTIARQNEVEQKALSSSDQASEPSALCLGRLCEMLSEDAAQKRVLYRFGYLVGRYVYLIDALDDLEKDQKSGNYNPFLVSYTNLEALEQSRQAAFASLNLTMAEIASAYELLTLYRFAPILQNVVYLGFHNTIRQIKEKKGALTHERSV